MIIQLQKRENKIPRAGAVKKGVEVNPRDPEASGETVFNPNNCTKTRKLMEYLDYEVQEIWATDEDP